MLATSAGAAEVRWLGAITSRDRTHPLASAPSMCRPQTEPYLIGQAQHGRSVGHVGRDSEVAALARHQLQQPPPRGILRRLGPLLERLPARSMRLLQDSPWGTDKNAPTHMGMRISQGCASNAYPYMMC